MNEGERLCPDCNTVSLVRKWLTRWECLKPSCKSIHLTIGLDFVSGFEREDNKGN